MRIDYDPQADALYFQLKEGQVEDTLEVGNNVFVDVDADNAPLGIEILFVSRRFAVEDLTVTLNIGKAAELVGVHSA